MNSEMHFVKFTHGKCTVCGHLAMIDKFEQKKVNEARSDDGHMEMYQLVLTCPICQSEFCEALFPNDVN